MGKLMVVVLIYLLSDLVQVLVLPYFFWLVFSFLRGKIRLVIRRLMKQKRTHLLVLASLTNQIHLLAKRLVLYKKIDEAEADTSVSASESYEPDTFVSETLGPV